MKVVSARHMRRQMVALGAIAIATCSTPVLAQNADSAAAEEAQGGLADIIVTARKREESAQNIPVAVIALSGEELVKRNINNIEQLSQSVPQFIVARGSTGSGANLSLRGIGSNFTSIGIEQSVSVNVDGVYYGQGRILNEAVFDMAQAEVLKGPQALFFGKNATAGALSFTTADPSQKLEAMLKAGYEFQAQDKFVEGVISGPLTSTLSARLAVRWTDMDEGYVRNQSTGGIFRVTDTGAGGVVTDYSVPRATKWGPMERNINARGAIKWEPGSELSVTLKGSIADRSATTPGYLNELFNCPINGTSQLQPGNECNKNWKGYWNDLPRGLVSGSPLLGKENGETYDDYRSYTATGIVKYETDKFSLNWVSGYQQFNAQFMLKSDTTSNSNRGTYAGTETGYHAYSTELRAQTQLDLPINFMLGVYYQTSELNFQQDIIFPGSATAGHSINSGAPDPSLVPLTVRKLGVTDGKTFAAFGQAIWDIVPTLQMTAGGRLTRETKDSDYYQPYVHPALRAAFRMYDPSVPASRFTHHQKFTDFSPEVTLTWKPQANLTIYGAYKTGYKSGGFSISGLNTPNTKVSDLAFSPETVEGFEAGIRSQILDNQLRLNLTAFTYDYNNLQVDFFNSAITTFVTFNAGTARTRGIELDTEFAPRSAPGLSIRGTLAYNDAEYTNFPGAPCYAGETPALGCLAATAAIPYVHQDLKGKSTQLAPKWTGSVSATYESSIGLGLKAGLSANLRFSDSYRVSPFGNPIDRQGSYAMLDAALRLGAENDRWQVALIGKNLTNKYVLTYGQDASSTGSGTGTVGGIPADQFGFPLPPRTAALQVTFRY